MEAAGLVVGVAGLAGLFSACLDGLEKAQSYRGAGRDFERLHVRFQADILRFKKWGQEVGFRQDDVVEFHHAALHDEMTKANVNQVLAIILDICKEGELGVSRMQSGLEGGDRLPQHDFTTSKRKKVSWTLWGKEKREKDVELLETLVQKLYDLVPPDAPEQRPPQVFETMNDLAQDLKKYIAKGEEELTKREQERKARLLQDLDSWIMGSDQSSDIFHEATKNRLDQTCEWILHRSEFMEWLSEHVSKSASRLLWIHGPAGFGKTILFSKIIEYLVDTRTAPVVYFLFSSDYESRRDSFTAIRSWLSQLVRTTEKVFDRVYEVWVRQGQREASPSIVEKLFVEAIQLVPGCILALDGLDECKSANDPYIKVTQMIKKSLEISTTRALVVSRREPDIRLALGDDLLECRIFVDDVRADIALVSQHVVLENLPNKSESVRAELSKGMADRCDGQFLWLKLQAHGLQKWKNKKQLQQAINEAPAGLHEMYEREWQMLENFGPSERLRAISLLRWVAFAFRPLSVGEISEAVLLEDGCKELPLDELPDVIDEDYVEGGISRLCGSLIEIRESGRDTDPRDSNPNDTDPVNDKVVDQSNNGNDDTSFESMVLCITHFSVRQFLFFKLAGPGRTLTANRNLTFSTDATQNAWLARMCIEYISFPRTWDVPVEAEEADHQMGTRFRRYAATQWHRHVNFAEACGAEMTMAVSSFFGRSMQAWNQWVKWDTHHNEPQSFHSKKALLEKHPNLLVLASKLGLITTVMELLKAPDCDVNQPDAIGRTALYLSCAHREDGITYLLIDAGADPMKARGFTPEWEMVVSPMSYLVSDGEIELLRHLVDRGVDLNRVSDGELTPLTGACIAGHLSVVQFLLENGADVHKYGGPKERRWSSFSPLHAAALCGHAEVVDWLVKSGSHVDAPKPGISYSKSDGNLVSATPLYLSVRGNHLNVVKTLLKHGADPHRCFSYWETTLVHVAAANGAVDTLKLLLAAGVEPNKPKKESLLTPLHLAKNTDAASVLLDYGANLAQLTKDGDTPLHWTAYKGRHKLIRLFLQRGATIDTQNKFGDTPLQCAISSGQMEAAELLVNSGADVNQINHDGDSPLTSATDAGHLELVRLLLHHHANTEYAQSGSRTALHLASMNGCGAIVQVLLHYNAHVNAQDEGGSTSLHLASRKSHLDVMNILIQAGADIEAIDHEGSVPLHDASLPGNDDAVKLLLSYGADPMRQNSHGWAALHLASKNGHDRIVTRLLGTKGLNINLKETFYHATPLNLASKYGNDVVVQLLLETGQADVNSKDACLQTPISFAAEFGHTNVVSLLLNTGRCDIHQASSSGLTPLQLADLNNREDIVKMLMDHGAAVSELTDLYGLTKLFAIDD